MKVSELIAKLSELPQDYQVLAEGSGGVYDVDVCVDEHVGEDAGGNAAPGVLIFPAERE